MGRWGARGSGEVGVRETRPLTSCRRQTGADGGRGHTLGQSQRGVGVLAFQGLVERLGAGVFGGRARGIPPNSLGLLWV